MEAIFKKIKALWNEPKPTNEELKVSQMMTALFDGQSTEQVIDTLILFEEKTKAKLSEIKQQANTDKFVVDFYLGTSKNETLKV